MQAPSSRFWVNRHVKWCTFLLHWRPNSLLKNEFTDSKTKIQRDIYHFVERKIWALCSLDYQKACLKLEWTYLGEHSQDVFYQVGDSRMWFFFWCRIKNIWEFEEDSETGPRSHVGLKLRLPKMTGWGFTTDHTCLLTNWWPDLNWRKSLTVYILFFFFFFLPFTALYVYSQGQ